jgi:hypothetical protein
MEIEANASINDNHNQSVQYSFLHRNRGKLCTKNDASVQHLLNPYGRMDPYSLDKNRGLYCVIRTAYRISEFVGLRIQGGCWHIFQGSLSGEKRDKLSLLYI